jgi:hypothetical protein
MKLFRCLAHGVNFPLDIDGEPALLGFYTTRFVRADNAEQAELQALELLRADPELDVPPDRRSKETIVYFEEIEEIDSIPEDIPESGTGYAFYNMDS